MSSEYHKRVIARITTEQRVNIIKFLHSLPEIGVELYFQVCSELYNGKEPRRCCSGKDCGCMGQPIDPMICSQKCWDDIMNKYK